MRRDVAVLESQRSKCFWISGPRKSSSDSQSGSGLMKTKPAQVPTLTSGRVISSLRTSRWGKSHSAGIFLSWPSRCQAKPWKGQRNSLQRPS